MNYLKTILLSVLCSFQLYSADEVNKEELKKLSDRSVQLMNYVQSRCVTIMQEGAFKEKSGVIVSKDGYIFTSHIRVSDNENYVVYLPDGKRVTAKLIDSNIRKGVALLKINEDGNWPEVELGNSPVEVNSWGLIGGFGLERMRNQEAQLKLARVLKYDEDRKHIVTFSSCLHSDEGGPMFDMDGRLVGIVSAIGNHQYQTRVTHISAYEEFDEELMKKLAETKTNFTNNMQLYSKILVNKPTDDEDELFVDNIKLMQNHLHELHPKQNSAVVQVNSNDSPSIMGTVISSDGYILTKASEVGSNLSCEINGKTYQGILYAEDHENDLAIIKIDEKGLTAVEWSAHTTGSFIYSPAQNDDELGFGIIGHETAKFPKSFYNVNSPEKNTGLGAVIEHAANEFKIAAFLPESPLKTSGAVIGDIVTSVNGIKTPDRKDVIDVISKLSPGTEISLEIKTPDGKTKNLVSTLIKEEEKEYPSTDRDYRVTDFSKRRADFPAVFMHDAITEAWQCGGPVFDLNGKAVGINVARHNRTTTLAIPSEVIVRSIAKMMKNSIKF